MLIIQEMKELTTDRNFMWLHNYLIEKRNFILLFDTPRKSLIEIKKTVDELVHDYCVKYQLSIIEKKLKELTYNYVVTTQPDEDILRRIAVVKLLQKYENATQTEREEIVKDTDNKNILERSHYIGVSLDESVTYKI